MSRFVRKFGVHKVASTYNFWRDECLPMLLWFGIFAMGNVHPGLINPWLINRGVPPFSGDASLLEGTPPEQWDGFIDAGSTLNLPTCHDILFGLRPFG